MSLRRIVRAHFESGEVRHAVYGTIMVLAVIGVLERHPPSSAAIFASVLGTALAVALAEMYAEFIGISVRYRRRLTRQERWEFSGELLRGFALAVAPVGFFILEAAGVIGLDTAFTVAVWFGVALLGFYGVVANRYAALSWPRSLAGGITVALIGAFLILLKQAFH